MTYKYIALSATGEQFIAEFTATAYDEFVGEWKTLLSNHFAAKN